MEEKEDHESEGDEVNPGAPVANIRRQVTCGRCGQQGHTARNRNCPQRQAEVVAAAPIVAHVFGGQIHQAVEGVDLVNIVEDLQLPMAMALMEGLPEPDGEDIPQELAEVDQEPPPPEREEDNDMIEWPEVPQLPLPEDVRAEDANMPPFYKPERRGRPNFMELNDANPNLDDEASFAALFLDDFVLHQWVHVRLGSQNHSGNVDATKEVFLRLIRWIFSHCHSDPPVINPIVNRNLQYFFLK
jgi:hypothetical protein